MTQYGTLSPEAAPGTIPEGDALLSTFDQYVQDFI
jgi:two-component system response regulator RegA